MQKNYNYYSQMAAVKFYAAFAGQTVPALRRMGILVTEIQKNAVSVTKIQASSRKFWAAPSFFALFVRKVLKKR